VFQINRFFHRLNVELHCQHRFSNISFDHGEMRIKRGGQQMKVRKVVSTILIGAMLFFAPSMIPIKAVRAVAATPCGVSSHPVSWLPMDTAFAGAIVNPPVPCPTGHHTPVTPWVVIGCAGSIVLSALVADFRDHRELTTAEAWTCGLLYWIPMPYQQQPVKHGVRAKG
jgi:hypothetical protein